MDRFDLDHYQLLTVFPTGFVTALSSVVAWTMQAVLHQMQPLALPH